MTGQSLASLIGWPINWDLYINDSPAYEDGAIYRWQRTGETKRLVALDADNTPPDTTLARTDYSGRTDFVITTGESPVTLECRLDAADWSACTSPITISHASLGAGQHVFQARASDQAGNVDPTPAAAVFVVQPPPSALPPPPGDADAPQPPPGRPGVSINAGDPYTNDPEVTIRVVWPLGVRTMLISTDSGFASARNVVAAAKALWRLESSGPERLPKTIYVRFGSSTQTFQGDIILDETRPKVSTALLAPVASPGQASTAARKRAFKVTLRATDKTSGVSKVQFARSKRKPSRAVKYARRLTVRGTVAPRYVRAEDRAGNLSVWKKLKPKRR